MADQTIIGVTCCSSYDDVTVERAVEAALECLPEGIGALVKPGTTVLLNPNLLSPSRPEAAVTTHPALVSCIARKCFAAGASRVWIGDSCAGEHSDEVLWEKTGMKRVAVETGAELVSFKTDVVGRPCVGIQIPVPAFLSEVDVHISLPKLKTHALTGLTCAMKNTFGLVVGRAKSLYHAQNPSPRSMSRFLFEVYRVLQPDLIVVDAVLAMEGEGPATGRPFHAGLIVAGINAIAVDVVCAGMIRGNRRHIPMLEMAKEHGSPGSTLEEITLVGDGLTRLATVEMTPSIGRWLQAIPEPVFRAATRILACHPKIVEKECVGCGICARICSQGAIEKVQENDTYQVDSARCIMCMCCAESCPQHAIIVRSPLGLFSRIRSLVHRVGRVPQGGEGDDSSPG